MADEHPEMVCALTPEAVRARRDDLLPGLAATAREHGAIPGGYQLVFAASAGLLRRIAEVIDAEGQCCRWLSFELTVSPGGGPVVLTLRGPNGARDFLSELLGTSADDM